MRKGIFLLVICGGFLQASACADDGTSIRFVDGLWSGGTGNEGSGARPDECWASQFFGDGTTFTLARRSNGSWQLRLSNQSWQFPEAHNYAMTVQVDFYPRLSITALASTNTRIEIADLDRISLLGLIENGHTIDLWADGFAAKYDLEGSAKVIHWIRGCFTDHLSATSPD